MNRSIQTVTIFGTSKARPGDDIYEMARRTGFLLAQQGCRIANGGYGGTMRAAAEGAREAGGEVIGVTCTAFKSTANEFVTREISTPSLQARLHKLIELADACIVLPGGTGTLVEIAMVWEHRNKGFDEKNKPIIIAGDFWLPLLDLMEQADAGCSTHIIKAASVEEIPSILKSKSGKTG